MGHQSADLGTVLVMSVTTVGIGTNAMRHVIEIVSCQEVNALVINLTAPVKAPRETNTDLPVTLTVHRIVVTDLE